MNSARDDFSRPTKRALAERVANRCSNPGCRAVTSGPHSEAARALNVGVAAHITAARKGGPRYDETLSEQQRGSAENAIWLCQTCGKLVDNDASMFPVTLLHEWKFDAERSTLGDVGKNAELPPSDREELWRLIKKYSPDATAEFLFREGYEALSAADPSISYEVEIENRGVTVTARSKDGEPISATFAPVFDDSDAGRAKAVEFARFLDEGSAVELDETNIDPNDLPDPLRRLFRERGGRFKLRMGPRKPRTFAVALVIKNANGDFYEFPYIEYGTNRFDGRSVVLSNAQQKIPFHCEEILNPDASATFSWHFTIKTFSALREQLRFQKVLSEPCQVILRDLDDGLEHVAGVTTFEQETVEYPIDIIERVLGVQQKTRTAIPLPRRAFFTPDDLQQLGFIEAILRDGRQPRPPQSFGVTLGSEEGRVLLRQVLAGSFELSQLTSMHVETLLDIDISLGPTRISCERVTVSNEDATRLGEFLDDESPSYPQQFRLIPAPGANSDVRYLWWEKKADPSDPEAEMPSELDSRGDL